MKVLDDSVVLDFKKLAWSRTAELVSEGLSVPESVLKWCAEKLTDGRPLRVCRNFGSEGVAFVNVERLGSGTVRCWGWLPARLENGSSTINSIKSKYYVNGICALMEKLLRLGFDREF